MLGESWAAIHLVGVSVIDPKQVLKNTDSFYEAAAILGPERRHKAGVDPMATFIPSLVLNAFSLELHLKCLLALEGRKTRIREHDHVELFEMVSKDGKANIRAIYESDSYRVIQDQVLEKTLGLTFTFDEKLEGGSNAFMSYRYAYEKAPAELPNWLSGPITNAVRRHIELTYPDVSKP